jgi:murein L,D-transpeptidase YcbB/YkuD
MVAPFASLVLLVVAGCGGQVTPPPAPELFSPPPRVWDSGALVDLRSAADIAVAHGLTWPSDSLEEVARLEPLSVHDVEAARRLDEVADQLFADLATAFAIGATDPAIVDSEWRIARPPAPDIEMLRSAVRDGAGVSQTLVSLLPTSPEYAALVAELARVRTSPNGEVQSPGPTNFEREARLRATLERWRWLPRNLPARRIEVLAPFFELRMRQGELSVTHVTIVGARRTQTPSFIAAIETITLNPTWTPPSSIMERELIPRFRRDPDAVTRENFDVLDSSGRTVEPATVDWRARPFPYTLRQRPGPSNALGRLRFDLPNPYAVFLHDTPSRSLFARADRALSHGCIRVAEPVALATMALGDAAWDQAAIEAAIDNGATQTIALASPLPIYVLYVTAAADSIVEVRYADDIYGRDVAILRALDRSSAVGQRGARAWSQSECSMM